MAKPKKVELADDYLSGTDSLWSKHPKKIVIIVICGIIYLLWQYRYDILDFYYEIKGIESPYYIEQEQLNDSLYQEYPQDTLTQ